MAPPAVFRAAAGRTGGKIRRVEERPLGLGTDAVDDARADLATAAKLAGDALQEGIAAVDRERPGSG
jgi:hypothetical protein